METKQSNNQNNNVKTTLKDKWQLLITSRKFWMSVAGLIATMLGHFVAGLDIELTTTLIGAIIMAFVVGQGIADSNGGQSEATEVIPIYVEDTSEKQEETTSQLTGEKKSHRNIPEL